MAPKKNNSLISFRFKALFYWALKSGALEKHPVRIYALRYFSSNYLYMGNFFRIILFLLFNPLPSTIGCYHRLSLSTWQSQAAIKDDRHRAANNNNIRGVRIIKVLLGRAGVGWVRVQVSDGRQFALLYIGLGPPACRSSQQSPTATVGDARVRTLRTHCLADWHRHHTAAVDRSVRRLGPGPGDARPYPPHKRAVAVARLTSQRTFPPYEKYTFPVADCTE